MNDVLPAPGGACAPPTDDPIRILVVDDHALFRRGLVSVLAAEPDIDVVGEAGDGADAMRRAADLLPDVVLMDIRMPHGGGITACAGIKDVAPTSRIVMLTSSDEEADLFGALRAGAVGYLLKSVSVAELPTAVRAVHKGHSFLTPAMAAKLIREFTASSGRERGGPVPVPPPALSTRETQVLRLIARGLSNRDIAAELVISDNTVKNHVRNILDKLQLHSRVEAAVYAVRENVLGE
ncbi:response regulator [Marinactinospora thermotolerans]|uniref:Two component transcriptional regulator, LuxR family n=1 Tax=Marinactinospora thermotolerans DSM 45154 TaxID=1122192 RepID=A0A1T4LSY8_9ACTN|nr:response regulator transcription factor [Marinactinospora thermotolerans]SJZ57822.1 two component transcriptional regulator, LuxR family [Marinactinospora thermotolerans DSM 45154]